MAMKRSERNQQPWPTITDGNPVIFYGEEMKQFSD